MKRMASILITALLVCSFSCAHAVTLPDVPVVGGVLQQQDYAFSDDFICDVWVYPCSDSAQALIRSQWLADCVDHGFTVSRVEVEGYPAYQVMGQKSYALLLPAYNGVMLLLIGQGLSYGVPEEPVKPTPSASQESGGGPSGSWVYVEVTRDCPLCLAGYCSLCNGSGIRRLYGQEVPCERYCRQCDGKGTYQTYELRFVPN